MTTQSTTEQPANQPFEPADAQGSDRVNPLSLDTNTQAALELSRQIRLGPLLSILGPTASGKTALAFELKDRLGDAAELISVDSALVYRGLDIGSAKPTPEELRAYPHALIDIRDPNQPYSVSEFTQDAGQLILGAQQAGKLPVLVGGSMLYFKALVQGLDPLPAADPVVRRHLAEQLQVHGIKGLHKQLKLIDPVLADRLKSTDTQRIMRGLEVHAITGKPLSALQSGASLSPGKQWVSLALTPERTWVHERIEQRLELMWQMGMMAEVAQLMQRYPDFEEHTWSKAVGYRQVIQYLMQLRQQKPANYDQVMEPSGDLKDKTLYATRQLAKRQYTWIRRFERQIGLNCYDNATGILEEVKKKYSL